MSTLIDEVVRLLRELPQDVSPAVARWIIAYGEVASRPRRQSLPCEVIVACRSSSVWSARPCVSSWLAQPVL